MIFILPFFDLDTGWFFNLNVHLLFFYQNKEIE